MHEGPLDTHAFLWWNTDESSAALPRYIYHTALVYQLGAYHNDPFDRLLIAARDREHLPILTADPQITRYPTDAIG